ADAAKVDRQQRIVVALAEHRRLFGEQERQFPLWMLVYKNSKDEAERLRISRDMLAAAEKMNSPRALLEARLAVFRHLPKTDPGRRPLAILLSEDALTAAATPVVTKNSQESSCYGPLAGFTEQFTEALAIAGR